MSRGISIGWSVCGFRLRPRMDRRGRSVSVSWLGFFLHYWDYRHADLRPELSLKKEKV